MIQQVSHFSLLVKNQEEALQWYRDKLGFEVRSDSPFPDSDGRWLTIAPKGQQSPEIVLQPAEWGLGDPAERVRQVGKQPGWVLVTDDCRKDYETLSTKGVKFVSPPEEVPWGISALIEDLYGNVHNLLEPRMG